MPTGKPTREEIRKALRQMRSHTKRTTPADEHDEEDNVTTLEEKETSTEWGTICRKELAAIHGLEYFDRAEIEEKCRSELNTLREASNKALSEWKGKRLQFFTAFKQLLDSNELPECVDSEQILALTKDPFRACNGMFAASYTGFMATVSPGAKDLHRLKDEVRRACEGSPARVKSKGKWDSEESILSMFAKSEKAQDSDAESGAAEGKCPSETATSEGGFPGFRAAATLQRNSVDREELKETLRGENKSDALAPILAKLTEVVAGMTDQSHHSKDDKAKEVTSAIRSLLKAADHWFTRYTEDGKNYVRLTETYFKLWSALQPLTSLVHRYSHKNDPAFRTASTFTNTVNLLTNKCAVHISGESIEEDLRELQFHLAYGEIRIKRPEAVPTSDAHICANACSVRSTMEGAGIDGLAMWASFNAISSFNQEHRSERPDRRHDTNRREDNRTPRPSRTHSTSTPMPPPCSICLKATGKEFRNHTDANCSFRPKTEKDKAPTTDKKTTHKQ